MYGYGKFDSIRSKAAEVFTQILFAAVAAIVVGGTAALSLEPALQLA